MIAGRSTLETTLELDGIDTEVIIGIDVSRSGEWQLAYVETADDGTQIVLTSDLNSTVTNFINEHFDEVEADLEGSYADYCYELARDQRMMEQ